MILFQTTNDNVNEPPHYYAIYDNRDMYLMIKDSDKYIDVIGECVFGCEINCEKHIVGPWYIYDVIYTNPKSWFDKGSHYQRAVAHTIRDVVYTYTKIRNYEILEIHEYCKLDKLWYNRCDAL